MPSIQTHKDAETRSVGALWNSLSQLKRQLMKPRHHFHKQQWWWWSILIAVITWPSVKTCWLTKTDILPLIKCTLKKQKNKNPQYGSRELRILMRFRCGCERRHIQQKEEDYSSLHSWSPYGRAESNCWTFALDKTKSDTNEWPLRFNSEYGCLIIPPLILCLWKTVHWRPTRRAAFSFSKNRNKNWTIVFWGSDGTGSDHSRKQHLALLGRQKNTPKPHMG